MRGILRLTVIALGLSNSPAVLAQAKALSLNELIKVAVAESPTLEQARIQREQADLAKLTADRLRWPGLTADSSHGWRRTLPDTAATETSDWSSQVGLTLTQPIYRSGAISYQQDQAALQAKVATIEYQRRLDELVANVEQAVYRHQLADALSTMAVERRDRLAKQFRDSERAYRSGFRRERDYLRIKSQYQRAQIQEAIAKDRIEQAAVSLAKSIGRSAEQPILIQRAKPTNDNRKFADLKPLTDEQFYEFQTAELQLELATNQVGLTKAETGLQIGVEASAQYGASGYMGTGDPMYERDSGSWGAALSMSYPLWDWGTQSRQRRSAALSRESAKASKKSAVLAAREQHLNLLRQYDRERANFKLNKDLLDLEQRNLAAMERDYQQGQISYLDLVTAIEDFYSAKSSYLSNYYNLLELESQYQLAAGASYAKYR